MHTLRDFVVVAALAVSTAAAAAPSHLTDMQYIEAARCQALIASPALGKGDTSTIDALVKSEGRSRIDYVSNKADETRREAARLASQASPERRATLMAERDGACAAFSGEHATTVTTASGSTRSN
jgi:hypothetical protein